MNLSPSEETNHTDSLSTSFDTTSAEPLSLNTRTPSLEISPPEDLNQPVNKGFGVTDHWGQPHPYSYRTSILELSTKVAK